MTPEAGQSAPRHFRYGETEIAWLSARDEALGRLMAAVGPIRREVIPEFFTGLCHAIVGQQISSRVHAAVWGRVARAVTPFTPATVAGMEAQELRALGMSLRKAAYLRGIAARILAGELDLDSLRALDDEALLARLCALPGVGRWTAEMVMLFTLERKDILSFGDYGIRRGLCLLHGHRSLTPFLYRRWRRRYSPCGSVASLYLWALAGGEASGAVPEKNA